MNKINLSDIKSPELVIYSGLSEPQLYHYYEPEPGLFIAESPMIIRRAVEAGYEPVSVLIEERSESFIEQTLAWCGLSGIPVYTAGLEVLTKITGYALTRGVLCAMRRKPAPPAEQVLTSRKKIVVLENVMNPANVGAIFRSAAALGMDAVLLTDGCSDPFYRRAARVSMGTVFQIPWAYTGSGVEAAQQLKALGFRTAAMTLSDHAVPLNQLQVGRDETFALFMGTEGPGLLPQTVDACDLSVIIPMAHGVDSLNVAAASAVAFWHCLNA